MSRWCLEGYFDSGSSVQVQPLKELPLVIGRDDALPCTIYSPSVSRKHARFEERDDGLWISDVGSSNGTFVNHKKINSSTHIGHGDVIHLGTAEVRLVDNMKRTGETSEHTNPGVSSNTTVLAIGELSEQFPIGVRELEELIERKQVVIHFQPIIQADELVTCGHEALGRGASSSLPSSPLELFRIAESNDLDVDLSELLRDTAIEVAAQHSLRGDLYVNTHPREMEDTDRLLASLTSIRKRFRALPLMLEIHEQAVTDIDSLKTFIKELNKLNIKLAFDDFGVGQSRLLELVSAKPDLIKFDRVLISGLDKSDVSRQNLVRHLKELASELSIKTLAECVSNEGEYLASRSIGFEFYQGFYFCKPQPISSFK